MIRLGYVGQNLTLGISASRGTVLRNATPERLRLLIGNNLSELARILGFNSAHAIQLFRISSRIIPFASHPINRVEWWGEFAEELSTLGRFVRDQGMRVSMHPGQHTVLNSPVPQVLEATVRDLQWHTRFLDGMGLGPEHKVVLHCGGVYEDKPAAIERFVANCSLLSVTERRRLVLENDERLYTVDDALAISGRTGLPVVVDLLHHRANPSGPSDPRALLQQAFPTWHRETDGPPKVHFSTQAPGRRSGAHADYIDPDEFLKFYQQVADLEFDCMLEAKAKDRALLRLRAQLMDQPRIA